MLIDLKAPGVHPVQAIRPKLGRCYAVLGYVSASGGVSALAAAVAVCWPEARWGRCGPSVVDFGDEALEAMIAAGVTVPAILAAGVACVEYLGALVPRADVVDDIAGNSLGPTEPTTST